MAITDELIDELLKEYQKPEDLTGETGILKTLTTRLLERALSGEMTTHLGYEKHEKRAGSNARNGYSKKEIQGNFGKTTLNIPRDREGAFEPEVIKKGQRRFDGFDDKIISLYARGLTTRDIQGHLAEIYGVEVSPALISNVTAEVMDEVKAWQNRPLDAVYPIVYFDAMFVKVRHEKQIVKKAVYFALGINMEGTKELLGMWIQKTEGAGFWVAVLTELQNRGVEDMFFACIDGLKGFPEAIENLFPRTLVQLCIVHMVRNSLKFVGKKNRKEVAACLREVYTASTLEQAEANLETFREKWDEKYPSIWLSWNRHWAHIVPFFNYPQEIRRVLYTTNPMEAVNRSIRKISKTRGVFPHEDSVRKLFYLAIRNISAKWTQPIKNWKAALNRFVIEFGERVPIT